MPIENPVRYSTIHVVLTFQSQMSLPMSTVSQGLRITSWIKLAIGFCALSIFSTLLYHCSYRFALTKNQIQLGNVYGKDHLTNRLDHIGYQTQVARKGEPQRNLSSHIPQQSLFSARSTGRDSGRSNWRDVASQKRSSTFHFLVGHIDCLVTSLWIVQQS